MLNILITFFSREFSTFLNFRHNKFQMNSQIFELKINTKFEFKYQNSSTQNYSNFSNFYFFQQQFDYNSFQSQYNSIFNQTRT